MFATGYSVSLYVIRFPRKKTQMKAEHILSNMTPEQRCALTLEQYEKSMIAEANVFAKIRRIQVDAYTGQGFTPEQAIQFIVLTRKQEL
jgi:hypothetical protein